MDIYLCKSLILRDMDKGLSLREREKERGGGAFFKFS